MAVRPRSVATNRAWPFARTAALLILLSVALGVRLTALVAVSGLPWFTMPDADAALYHQMARTFAGGDLLIGTEPLRMSPFYPFFAGTVYSAFGDSPAPLRLMQLLMGVGLVLLTWDIARRVAGHTAAWVAGTLVAFFGPLVFYEAQILSDAPAAALAGFALWTIVRARTNDTGSIWPWCAAGLATGAVVLFRSNALVLALPLAVAAWESGGGSVRWRRLTTAALGLVIAASLVPVRNLLATGRPTLLAAHSGLNFFIGNGPGATGAFVVMPEVSSATGPESQLRAFHAVAERAAGRELDDAEVDKYWRERTVSYVLDDPARWARLMAWKLRLYWSGTSISDMEHYEFTRDLTPLLRAAFVQWWLLMPLALIGTVLIFGERGPARTVAWFNLAWCAGVIVAFVLDRYRLPGVSGLAVAAGLAPVQLARAWKSSPSGMRAGLMGLVVCAAALAPAVAMDDNRVALWLRLGAGYERAGRIEDARDAYRRAAEVDPSDPRPRLLLER